jgi:Aldehyde dehydrogenase family
MKIHFHRFILSLAVLGNSSYIYKSVYAEPEPTNNVCVESLTEIPTLHSGSCTPLGVPPMIDGASFLSESLPSSVSQDIFGCCSMDGDASLTPAIIGKMPQFTTEKSLQILEAAKKAWNHGRGVWPQKSLNERIEAVEAFLEALKIQRGIIINLLMWEIGKNYNDAAAEFDRTIDFAKKVGTIHHQR